MASGRRQGLKPWREAANQLAEEGRLLWLVGQGLQVALSAAERSQEDAPPVETLRAWAARTVSSLVVSQREMGGRASAQRASGKQQRPGPKLGAPAVEASRPGVFPAIWVASQPVRGEWVTLSVAVDLDGRRRVLALLEGSTRDPVVVKALLHELEQKQALSGNTLLVTDGSRTLDEAVAGLARPGLQVAHCRKCLRREVAALMPEGERPGVVERLDNAWGLPADAATSSLRAMVASLRHRHPGAAERLERSLDASLCVARLGVACPLRDGLEVAGAVRTAIAGALEWGGSAAAGVVAVEAGLETWQRRTRRMMGYEGLATLVHALQEKAVRVS